MRHCRGRSRCAGRAAGIIRTCAALARRIIESRAHPEQGYRACLGIIRLSKSYEPARVEAACRRALALDVCSYRSIQSILKTGKDREALPGEESVRRACRRHHPNVRGAKYYSLRETVNEPAVAGKGGV